MVRYTKKLKPHYDRERLKKLIRNEDTRDVTGSSIRNAVQLGFSLTEIIDVVLSLKMSDFSHSMTSEHSVQVWHDVYKTTSKKTNLYIKLQESTDGKGVVINFKKDDEGGQ